MNIYCCWYRGNYGYSCRTWGKKWMFVPELGQPDNQIYKNLSLHELVFKNKYEKQFELDYEKRLNKFDLIRFTKLLAAFSEKPKSVAGKLLSMN